MAEDALLRLEAVLLTARGRLEWRRRLATVLAPSVAVLVLLLFWEYGARLFAIPPYLLPGPQVVLASMRENAAALWTQGLVTTWEIVLGFALSVAVGLPLALAIFLWQPFARAVYPLMIASQAMPKVAVAPLFLVWFGFGLLPKVLIGFLICFFPMVVNTTQGLISTDSNLVAFFKMCRASKVQTILFLRVPAALPYFFTGLRIAATLAPIGAIVGDYIAGNSAGGQGGLGFLTIIYSSQFQMGALFATAAVGCLLGFIFVMGVIALSWLALHKWHDSFSHGDT